MVQKKSQSDGTAKITIEITPTGDGARVKPYRKVLEFRINHEDLPLKVSAESAKVVTRAHLLAQEMCED